MRKSLLAVAIASSFGVPTVAVAQESAHTLSGNVGFFSQYIFRGIKQTDGKPALQGGFDYAHKSGFYAGTWASNVSWLADAGAYTASSLEWDFYGGYKGSFGDFGYDAGLLSYVYPGRPLPGVVEADTLEAYGAVSWKWLTAKLSMSLDDTFGVADSDGTWYLDLSANYPVTEKLAIQAHYGIQEFKGSTPAGVSNDSFASYKDWKLGVTYALPQSFTVGAYYTDTDMDSTQQAFYTNPQGRFLGKDTFSVFVQKTF